MNRTDDISGFSIERRNNVAILTFDRPEIRNPLSVSVIKTLNKEFTGFENDSRISCVIITGSIGAFASGADLREVAELDKTSAYQFGKLGQNLMRRIQTSHLNTIAAINGFCMGGALDLALACTSRIAVKTAVFAHPGVALGIITGWGGTQMLPKLVGRKNAYDMFLTAKRVDADEALRIGLVDSIAEDPVEAALKSCGGSK